MIKFFWPRWSGWSVGFLFLSWHNAAYPAVKEDSDPFLDFQSLPGYLSRDAGTAGLPVRHGFIISSAALGIFLHKRHLFPFKGDLLPNIPRLNWNKKNINDINRLSLKAESREHIVFVLVVFSGVLLQWPQTHLVQPLWLQ